MPKQTQSRMLSNTIKRNYVAWGEWKDSCWGMETRISHGKLKLNLPRFLKLIPLPKQLARLKYVSVNVFQWMRSQARMLPSIHMTYSELFIRFVFLKKLAFQGNTNRRPTAGKKKKTFISIIQFMIKPFKSERRRTTGFMKSFCTYPLFAYPVALSLSPW